MSHVRCIHCGIETEDTTKVSPIHKSTCKSDGKESSFETVGRTPKPVTPTPKPATTVTKSTTKKSKGRK